MDFTLEVYKADKRRKTGSRLVTVEDIDVADITVAESYGAAVYGPKCTLKVFETYVTRIHIMSKEEFTERYNTPRCCSPASESYWSM